MRYYQIWEKHNDQDKETDQAQTQGRAGCAGLAALTDRFGCFHADNTVRS